MAAIPNKSILLYYYYYIIIPYYSAGKREDLYKFFREHILAYNPITVLRHSETITSTTFFKKCVQFYLRHANKIIEKLNHFLTHISF